MTAMVDNAIADLQGNIADLRRGIASCRSAIAGALGLKAYSTPQPMPWPDARTSCSRSRKDFAPRLGQRHYGLQCLFKHPHQGVVVGSHPAGARSPAPLAGDHCGSDAKERRPRELIDPLIDQHRGRIFKTTGDGMLIEFASVVDATRCAVEAQRGMEHRSADVQEAGVSGLRIGIHVGDVRSRKADVFGDGVNVAARMKASRHRAKICVSTRTASRCATSCRLRFTDLGEHDLKNIARPVRVYRSRSGAEPHAVSAGGGTDPRFR